jgi:hypothetical protein
VLQRTLEAASAIPEGRPVDDARPLRQTARINNELTSDIFCLSLRRIHFQQPPLCAIHSKIITPADVMYAARPHQGGINIAFYLDFLRPKEASQTRGS